MGGEWAWLLANQSLFSLDKGSLIITCHFPVPSFLILIEPSPSFLRPLGEEVRSNLGVVSPTDVLSELVQTI